MKPSPKEGMLGRLAPGGRLVQILLKIKDSANAVADLQDRFGVFGAVIKQSSFYSVPGEGVAMFNAFVEMVDPKESGEKLAQDLKGSPFVIQSYYAEGRSYGVVDTLTFPVTFGGKRVLFMNQVAIARVFHGIQGTFGTGGDFILYQAGHTYGKEMEEGMVEAVGRAELQANLGYSVNLLGASGWGEPEVSDVDTGSKEGTISLHSCFECEGTKAARPVCSFVRGVLVGSVEVLVESELEAVETECIAMGHPACKFVIKRI